MRLFIGIGVPARTAEALANAATTLVGASQATRMRWTPPANMHITLSFLGQVHEARRDAIEQTLARTRAPRLSIELNGVGAFERVGVIFVDVKHTAALLSLAEQVITTMQSCGFARESRPYSPHITLARTRDRYRLRSIESHDPVFYQSFDATEFRLYQSVTRPGGAQYEVLHSFPLA